MIDFDDPMTWILDDSDEERIDLSDFLDEPTQEIKCECGAHHTPDRNLHSRWCPMFVPPMGEPYE